MTPAPSAAQVRAQAQAVRDRYPEARVIGIQAPACGGPLPAVRLGADRAPLVRCDSVLALRERLVDLPAGGPPLVVLTGLPRDELGADLLARLAGGKLFRIDPWQLVKARCGARAVDPRLVERGEEQSWIARALLDTEPEAGYPRAPSGFLAAETVWRHLFETLAGIPRGERDPDALLAWALAGTPRETLAALPEETRAGLAAAVEAGAGRTARVLFEAAGRIGREAVSVGLVAGVLFEAGGDERAAKARGKLEARLGLEELDAALAGRWTAAAARVLRRCRARTGDPPAAPAAVPAVLAGADALLRELGAGELAWRSAMLPASLDQRLARFARELAGFVDGGAAGVPDSLRAAGLEVLEHRLAADDARRTAGVEMALRLAGWLAQRRRAGACPPRGFGAAARAYRAEGSFVDQARARLWDGDASPPLADACARLARRADEARQEENRAFGALLASWPGTGAHDRDLLGVEEILARRVAPLAKVHPVLVLVVDAMSLPVFRELEHDLARRGWVELLADDAPAGDAAPARPTVIAALPTVTEVSRTSLLCGRITSGNAAAEKAGFAGHAGLRAAGGAQAPPVLFHKGDLREAGAAGLATGVGAALADPGQRVVGVVINAVDDHLAKGDQVRVPWTAGHVRPVEELLERCRAGGRAVVLVSDHGHVIERETEMRAGDGPERWREAAGPPAADEVLITGPRVVAPGRRLLAPWSERVRFGMKKNGYHGGAALQEVVLPLGVFAPPDAVARVAGWREVRPEAPGWWDWRSDRFPASAAVAPVSVSPPRRSVAEGEPLPASALHDHVVGRPPHRVHAAAVPDPAPALHPGPGPARRAARPGETGDLFALPEPEPESASPPPSSSASPPSSSASPPSSSASAPSPSVPSSSASPPVPSAPFPSVFPPVPSAPSPSASPPSSPSAPSRATWIDRLFATEQFAAQRRRAARAALSDERIRIILTALDARGGTLTRAALGTILGVPAFRLDGILSALRRILNVDGYDVLAVDDASESVTLNRGLLLVQFDVGGNRT